VSMCVREGCLLALNGGEAVCGSMRGLVSFVPCVCGLHVSRCLY
jgi:hypothetical protein